MADLSTKEAKQAENQSLLSLIQNAYGGLSVTEKKIADWVLNSPEQIMYHTVTQVAEELEIAQSTVTRFCRSIGLRGFQELKIRIAQDTERSAPAADGEEAGLPRKLAQLSANSVLDAASSLDLESLESALPLLVSARKIVIFGLGESGPMAQLLKIKLMGLGLTVDAQADIHLQAIAAAHMDAQDIAIGISQQGSTKDIVTALQYARQAGAKTMCITCHGKSPITEVSDIRLVCVSRGMSNIVESFRSKSSILYAIELLTVSLTLYLSSETKESEKKLWRTTESILDKLY